MGPELAVFRAIIGLLWLTLCLANMVIFEHCAKLHKIGCKKSTQSNLSPVEILSYFATISYGPCFEAINDFFADIFFLFCFALACNRIETSITEELMQAFFRPRSKFKNKTQDFGKSGNFFA